LQWEQPQPGAINFDGQERPSFQLSLSDLQRRDDLLPNDLGADIFASDLRHAGFLPRVTARIAPKSRSCVITTKSFAAA
jgi:hypothetical protein